MIEYEAAIEVATRMAQELQEFIDEGKQNGTPLIGTQALLEDWEAAYQQACQPREGLAVELDEPIIITLP